MSLWKPDIATKSAINRGNIAYMCPKNGDLMAPKKKRSKKRKNKAKKKEGFYQTREWFDVRYQALIKHGRQCQCCGAKPPNVRLHVDHIKPRSRYPELELCLDNLQILCEACNLGKSNKDQSDFR